jgi:hypothetical protein
VNREQTVQFLALIKAHVPADQSRSGWVVARCPMAPWRHAGGQDKKPSFAIRLEPGDAFANCFSCSWHGKQSDLLLALRYANQKNPVDSYPFGQALQLIAQAEEEIDLALDSPDIGELLVEGQGGRCHEFPDDWLASFPRWHESDMARDYLELRGVGFEVANMLRLRFDPKQHRVCFPVRDFKGRLMGLHGRALDDTVDPRYRMYKHAGRNNPLIWLGEHWVDLTRPIVVVEGPFDVAAIYQVYRNVVSPLFASASAAKLLRMADAFEWITLFDRGTGGDHGRAKVTQVFQGHHHVVHHLLPVEGKDAGEMSPDELAQVLTNYVKLDDFLLA